MMYNSYVSREIDECNAICQTERFLRIPTRSTSHETLAQISKLEDVPLLRGRYWPNNYLNFFGGWNYSQSAIVFVWRHIWEAYVRTYIPGTATFTLVSAWETKTNNEVIFEDRIGLIKLYKLMFFHFNRE